MTYGQIVKRCLSTLELLGPNSLSKDIASPLISLIDTRTVWSCQVGLLWPKSVLHRPEVSGRRTERLPADARRFSLR